jgi:uncharacterized protein (TIGR00288 family)
MKSHRAGDGERTLAVFIDFENLALGFGARRDRFDIEKVIERLVEKGKIVVKRAYADWSRFGNAAAHLHSAAVELVEIPKRSQTGKNSADIRMCVDAMDLAYSKDHIDTFVVVSGDSDFSPLVSKLKELGKHVIGLGLADSTSELLRDNCDEFIYYEDLDRAPVQPIAENPMLPEPKRKVFGLLLESLMALRRENKEVIFSSMVKDTMKRKKPSFNEEYHGYRTFSDLLEDAQRFGIVDLEKHKTSGTYVVTRFGSEPRLTNGLGSAAAAALPAKPPISLPAKAPVASPPKPPVVVAPPKPTALPPIKPPAPIPPKAPPVQQPSRSEQRRNQDRSDRSGSRYNEAIEIESLLEPLPLGRALIEDIDLFDDDIPSYQPKRSDDKPKSAPAKVEKAEPVKKVEKKPREVEKPATIKPVEPEKPKPPVKKKPPVEEDDFNSGLV